MIQINTQYATEFFKRELSELIETIGGEYELTLKDIDDLHDCTLLEVETDRLYYSLESLLSVVFDDCVEFLEDEQDGYDPFQHCDADFYCV